MKVALLGRTLEKLESKAQEIKLVGGEALTLVADVLDESKLIIAKEKLLSEWGRIDILINCAGGNMAGATVMPSQTFFDLSINEFDKVTDLNLKGTVLPTLIFSQSMAEMKKGSIINVSSMAAQQPLTRVVGYAAAKAAIDNLTKWLAVEFAMKYGPGMRVNAIAPGFFVGEQNRRLLFDESGELSGRGQTIIDHTPMKRFGEPEELCGAVNWLCSDAASFVTGTVISIDGGFSAYSGV